MPQSLVGTMILDAAKTAGLMGGVGTAAAGSQGTPPVTREASIRAIDMKGPMDEAISSASGMLDTVGSSVIAVISDVGFLIHDLLVDIHETIDYNAKLINFALDDIVDTLRAFPTADLGLIMTKFLGLGDVTAPAGNVPPTDTTDQRKPIAEESTAPKWMVTIMEAIKDVKDAPGAAKAAAGRAMGTAKASVLEIPGLAKTAGIIKEGMNISGDIKNLVSPGMSKLGKGAGGIAGAGAKAGAGALGGAMGGAIAGKAMKSVATGMPKMVGGMKKLMGKGMGMMGIQIGLSSLLRQSQIFTGFIGALFQILGGFVDVILAPFMPYFFKVLTKMAEYIPMVAAFAQKVHDWLAKNVFPIIAEWAGKISDWIETAYNWVKDTFFTDLETKFTDAKTYFTGLWDQVKEAFAPLWETFQETFDRFKVIVVDQLWPLIQTAWDVAQPIFTKIRDFLVDTVMPLVTTIFNELVKIYTDIFAGILEKLIPFIEELLPMIKDRIIEVIDKVTELVGPLKDSITGISDTLAPKITSLLDWMEANIFPLITKLTGVFFDTIISILDLGTALWAIMKPHIEKIVKAFNKDVMPILREVAGYAVEIVDAILDIINPLVALISVWIKFIFKILWWFIEKILRIAFKLLGYIWAMLKPVVKFTIWVLRQLPAIINGFTEFLESFLTFQWAKNWMRNVLEFFGRIIKGLYEFKVMGGRPFAGLKDVLYNMGRMYEGLEAKEPTTVQIAITNNIDGIKEPTQQQEFDTSDRGYRAMINNLDRSDDAASIGNWQASTGYS